MSSKGTAVVTLPTHTQILIMREFDAPKHLVYKAWTTPELIKRWWGRRPGRGHDRRSRSARRWHVALRDDGERIVSTEIYEGMPEGEAVNTNTFTERAGRTTVTILEHSSQEVRDAVINSGMEAGMQEAMDHLE